MGQTLRTPEPGRPRWRSWFERVRAGELRTGLQDAAPVAVAGLLVNGASVVVVVVVARLVTSREYGAIAQLLGLFFILSMPGSAVVVGVVRRVTAWRSQGRLALVPAWAHRVHRLLVIAIVVELVVVVATQHWLARLIGLPSDQGILAILMAGGLWILLCVDRGLLQSDRAYRPLASNLLLEGVVRTAGIVVLVAAGLGVSGYALGVLVGEILAVTHARWLVRRRTAIGAATPEDAGSATPDEAPPDGGRRQLVIDVSVAFTALGLLAVLQNIDVIVLGRYNHVDEGSYAAISVAAKALVFGALALGAYLLPEATIRWHAGGHAVRQLGVTLLLLAVPAGGLLGAALVDPRGFLALFFSPRLTVAAPAFATLVGAMIFLGVSVLLTNYLIGVGTRWVVAVLGLGAVVAAGAMVVAHGSLVGTARADLAVQSAVCLALAITFVIVHHRRHGARWKAQFGTVLPGWAWRGPWTPVGAGTEPPVGSVPAATLSLGEGGARTSRDEHR
jgi:O-antigen/teichoic acid export membrane protein